MNNIKLECSLNDTTTLKNLILENPDLPLIIFAGENANDGDYAYEQVYASEGEIKELTLYKDYWLDKDGYKEKLSNDLSDEYEYKHLSDKEYFEMIDKKVEETEFVKAIVIYVG